MRIMIDSFASAKSEGRLAPPLALGYRTVTAPSRSRNRRIAIA